MTKLADKIEAAHTPGPWAVSETDPTRVDGRDKFDEYSFAIASCRVPLVAPNHEEIAANARLIAAAPELLEAAERILERGYVSQSIEEERDDHDALKAAIAKARGFAAALRAGDTDAG